MLPRDASATLPVRGMFQRRPTRRMLHDVVILIQFLSLCIKIIKTHQKKLNLYFFPREGTLTLTPGMAGGGGPFRTPKSPKISTNKWNNRKLFLNILYIIYIYIYIYIHIYLYIYIFIYIDFDSF